MRSTFETARRWMRTLFVMVPSTSISTRPSMLKFIQTYPAIVNGSTGAGGLNYVKPKSVRWLPQP